MSYETWPAHRQLAETIHGKIDDLLKGQKMELVDIGGIVCYQGPGSFTGLRIGMSVGNALAYALGVSIVAEKTDSWISLGTKRLMDGDTSRLALPFYGADVHITPPRK